ncbi:MAG TPA: hypothetical protein PLK12_03530 [Prolixibacteraceae bacterium]|nr:hypothetical protein [Prolixibacteraceae bacterium]
MRSKEILKQALIRFKGTVLVVSHDREFLDGLVQCVYEFKDKQIRQHLGGIYDFIQKKKIESLRELEKNNRQNPEKTKTDSTNIKPAELSFEEKKEINRQMKRTENQVEEREKKIAGLEVEIARMENKLAHPTHIDETLFSEYEKTKRILEQTLYEWECLVEELEEWQNKKTW